MHNNPNTAEFMRDIFNAKPGGFTKKEFFCESFTHYINTGHYESNYISRIISELQNPSGNIPDSFIGFYAKNKDLFFEDISHHLIPRLFLTDRILIEKYNLDDKNLAKSIYSKICYYFKIPE